MLVYATDTELADWCDPIPDNAAVLLREASRLVRKATRCDVYDTDANGLPTDPVVVSAFRDATCHHAAYWASHNVNPIAGVAGVEAFETSSSIAGASVSLDSTQTAAMVAEITASLDCLVVGAVDRLRESDLASRRPGVW